MKVRLALLAAVVLALAVPVGASAHPVTVNTMAQTLGNATTSLTQPPADGGANFATTPNMRLKGFSERRVAPNDFSQINSDIAFWGDRAYQGTWSGFRIIDIDDPRNPTELIDYRDCAHPSGQGDMVVWGSILVRTWDANNINPPAGPARTCDGDPVPSGVAGETPGLGGGFEGLHVFDVSDPGNPDLVASVDLTCGSHTATGVPDLRNRRLIVYSTPSPNDTQPQCHGIDIVEVPLSRPEESEALRFEFAGRNQAEAFQFRCHDTAVILGRAMKAACAGGLGYALWSLGGKDGGSLDNPRFLYNRVVPEIAKVASIPESHNPTGHSAAFTWDGKTVIFGHEPGGGVAPRCQVTGAPLNASGTYRQTDDMKSLFFYDANTGAATGKWTLPRPQAATENCTIHNYNLIPTKTDDILVHGSYQSGVSAVDMSNTANAREIAYADPAPLTPTQTGGDWSSHFYNGYIYESDITRGLFVWKFKDRDADSALRLGHLNPQTQEFTIGAKHDRDRWKKGDKRRDNRWKGGGKD